MRTVAVFEKACRGVCRSQLRTFSTHITHVPLSGITWGKSICGIGCLEASHCPGIRLSTHGDILMLEPANAGTRLWKRDGLRNIYTNEDEAQRV